jgi:MFS family permease
LFFAFYILTPLLPIYLDARFHADKDTMGMVLSGYIIAALVVRPFSGFIVDSFNRHKVLMVCFFLFFLLFAGYLAAGTLLMFGIVRTLHGLPFGAVTVANSTVAIDSLHPDRRNEGIGYYGLSNNLAMAFAPSVGIWIYSVTDDFSLLFWVALVTALLGLLAVSTIRLPERPIVRRKEKLSFDRFFLTKAWVLALNIAALGSCWGIMSNYVAIYGKQELGITNGTGTFFMILSLGLFFSRIQGSAALRKGLILQNAAVGVLLSLVGFTLFAAVPQMWAYYLSAALIGLGNGHMYPAFLNMFIGVARHDQRGTANSSILTSWDCGMGFGILVGGFMSEYVSYVSAFWVAAGMQAVGVVVFFLFSRKSYLRLRITNSEPR